MCPHLQCPEDHCLQSPVGSQLQQEDPEPRWALLTQRAMGKL